MCRLLSRQMMTITRRLKVTRSMIPNAHRSLAHESSGNSLSSGIGWWIFGSLAAVSFDETTYGCVPHHWRCKHLFPHRSQLHLRLRPELPGSRRSLCSPAIRSRSSPQQYNVTEKAIMDLNPTVQRWATIQPGQKILVPAAPVANASPAPTTDAAPGTVEVVVGPGDSINRFAQRYGTTPARIRELNPHITNWASIKTGQKLLMPTPPSG